MRIVLTIIITSMLLLTACQLSFSTMDLSDFETGEFVPIEDGVQQTTQRTDFQRPTNVPEQANPRVFITIEQE